jgi:hypothetical protein
MPDKLFVLDAWRISFEILKIFKFSRLPDYLVIAATQVANFLVESSFDFSENFAISNLTGRPVFLPR